MPSKRVTSVCAAPLHHAIVKPEGGLESNTYSHPETSGARKNDQNKTLIVGHGGEEQRRKWSLFLKN